MTSSREAILDAALEAILEGGVRSLRVADVARRAGVSTALLYYHFADRAALVRAAIDHSNAEAPSAGLLRAAGRGADVVRAALKAELEDSPAVRRNVVIWSEVTALAAFEEELRPDLRALIGGWQRMLAEAIARGVEDGSIAPGVDPEVAAGTLTALIDGLGARWLAEAVDLPAARAQLELALDAVLGPADEAR